MGPGDAYGPGEADPLRARREQAVGQLVPAVTHEARNLLAGVRCLLDLLAAEEDAVPAELRPFVSEATADLDRLNELFGALLDLSRGAAVLSHLNGTIERVVDLLRQCGLERRTRLELALDAGVELVAPSPAILEAALLSLLGRVAAARPERLRIATRRADGCAILQVEASSCLGAEDELLEILRVIGEPRLCPTTGGTSVETALELASSGD